MPRSVLRSARTRTPSTWKRCSDIKGRTANDCRASGDRLAKDVLGRQLAVSERIALDAALLALLSGGSHGLADTERHEGHITGMMIGDIVKTLHREHRPWL